MVYPLLIWFKSLLFILPLWWSGFTICRVTKEKRFEVLLPAGLIAGMALYIVALNSIAFFVKGGNGLILSYLLLVVFGVLIRWKSKIDKIDLPKGKILEFWLIGLLGWGLLLFWDVGRTSFGGDVQLYYDIAKTFAHGNFPIVSPWQPDLRLAYHYGAAIFLGAFQFFIGAHFDFIHRLTSYLALFSLSQLLIWQWKRHDNVISWVLYNILPLVVLLSVGTVMLIWPAWPIDQPFKFLSNFSGWIKTIPSIHSSIETYGAPVTLEMLSYFLHFAIGLPVFFWIFWFLNHWPKKDTIFGWFLLLSILSSLNLINEALFIPALFMSIFVLGGWLIGQRNFRSFINFIIFGLLLAVIVFYEGGVITESFSKVQNSPSAVVFYPLMTAKDFPEGQDKIDSMLNYHKGQQSSKLFPLESGLPFRWYHVGLVPFFLATLIYLLLLWLKDAAKFLSRQAEDQRKAVILSSLAVSAIAAIISYNLIIPRYQLANSNRFLIIAYLILELILTYGLINLIEGLYKKKKKILAIFCAFLLLWIIIPALLPPAVLMAKMRTVTNRLSDPFVYYQYPAEQWLQESITPDKRVLDLTASFYYILSDEIRNPRYLHSLSEYSGVLEPKFIGDYRAYTVEAGPDYLDALYTLNPDSLKALKIDYVIVSDTSFQLLPDIRKQQLNNPELFKAIFDSNLALFNTPGLNNLFSEHEKIYRVENKYLEQSNLPGTLHQLSQIIPSGSKVYIDNWTPDRVWGNLRKGILFTLNDQKPFFIIGPGIYLNVERFIYQRGPQIDDSYDYMVLNKNTDPTNICHCQAETVWKGFRNQVVAWKVK